MLNKYDLTDTKEFPASARSYIGSYVIGSNDLNILREFIDKCRNDTIFQYSKDYLANDKIKFGVLNYVSEAGSIIDIDLSTSYRYIAILCDSEDIEYLIDVIDLNSNNDNNESSTEDNMNTNSTFDFQSVLNFKLLSKFLNSSSDDLDFTKIMMLQSITSGKPIEVTEVLKNKLMGQLISDDSTTDDLPIDKFLVINMLEKGSIEVNQVISMKILTKFLNDDSDDLNINKIMMLQSFTKGGSIEINDVIKNKIIGQLISDDCDTEDLPIEKLAILNMLNSGSIDINQIISLKLCTKFLNEDEKHTVKSK